MALNEEILPLLSRLKLSHITALDCVSLILLFCCVFCFSPFLLEGFSLLLVLSLFIPFALVIHSVEHFLPSVWLLLLLFIHVCGLSDLVADIQLLVKGLILYFDKQNNNTYTSTTLLGESHEEDDAEYNLFYIRLLLTMIGTFPFLLFLFVGRPTLNRLLKRAGQKPFFESSTSSSGAAGGAAILVIAIVWKVVVVFLRLYALLRTVWEVIRHGEVRESAKWLLEVFELLLLCDLLWSGIPLGVFTFLELFFLEEHGFRGDATHVMELIKLGAVVVDAMAACHLVYFGILPLGRCLFPHDAHHQSITHTKAQSKGEKEPLLINTARNKIK
ncbi:hypothetical protein QOT17_009830 [Balamuthia mandrillaris]